MVLARPAGMNASAHISGRYPSLDPTCPRALGATLGAIGLLGAIVAWSPVRVAAHSGPNRTESVDALADASDSREPAAKQTAANKLGVALSGAWDYRDGDAGRERIAAAIEAATASLDPLSRKIASERLEASLEPTDQIHVTLDAQRAEVDLGRGPAISGELGEWSDWTSDEGEAFRVHHEVRKGKLIQQMKSEHTQVVRSFSVKAHALTVSVRIDDDRLGDTIRFSLGYAKGST